MVFDPYSNPDKPWDKFPANFYVEKNLTDKYIASLCELSDSLLISNKINLLVTKKADLEDPNCSIFIQKNGYTFEKQGSPAWIDQFYRFYKGRGDEDILMLYKYKAQKE
jgi:hypothetical protein